MAADGNGSLAKVRKWLDGEGYPVEFECARMFSDAGHIVRQGLHVNCDDKLREIDVLAITLPDQSYETPPDIQIFHLVECKYSASPWVVFSTADKLRLRGSAAAVIGNAKWKQHVRLLDVAANVSTLFRSNGRAGFNAAVAYKDSGGDHAYKALMSLTTKAAAWSKWIGPSSGVHMVFPVIALRGELYEAFWDADHVELQKAPWLRLNWYGAAPDPTTSFNTTIDVVTMDHLPQYLSDRQRPLADLVSLLKTADVAMRKAEDSKKQKRKKNRNRI